MREQGTQILNNENVRTINTEMVTWSSENARTRNTDMEQ